MHKTPHQNDFDTVAEVMYDALTDQQCCFREEAKARAWPVGADQIFKSTFPVPHQQYRYHTLHIFFGNRPWHNRD